MAVRFDVDGYVHAVDGGEYVYYEDHQLETAQLQARVAELEGALAADNDRTDFSLKAGDIVEKDNWTLTKLIVVDVNWALRAAALRLGEEGNIVVWPVAGLRRA